MSRATSAISSASTMPACSKAAWPTARDATACARATATAKSRSKTLIASRPILSDFDLYLLGEGTHMHLYEKLGAHPMVLDGVAGVAFAVFAPAAKRVSVVGDFNFWDGRRHAMRVRGNGFWEIFVPGRQARDKIQIRDHRARRPHAAVEIRPAWHSRPSCGPQTASIVVDITRLPRPQPAPPGVNALNAPISIYEVHLGSWRRRPRDRRAAG